MTLSLHSLHSLHGLHSLQSAVCSLHGLRFNMTDKWMVKTTTTTELKTKIRELYLEANPRLHFMLH